MPRSSNDDEMLKHLDLLLSYDALEEEAAWELIADPEAGPATPVEDDEEPPDDEKHAPKKTGGHP